MTPRRARLLSLVYDGKIDGRSVYDSMPREWSNLDADSWQNYLASAEDPIPEAPERFVRVDRSAGSVWLTFAGRFDDAPVLHEDYQPMVLIDLDTGRFWTPTLAWRSRS